MKYILLFLLLSTAVQAQVLLYSGISRTYDIYNNKASLYESIEETVTWVFTGKGFIIGCPDHNCTTYNLVTKFVHFDGNLILKELGFDKDSDRIYIGTIDGIENKDFYIILDKETPAIGVIPFNTKLQGKAYVYYLN